MAKVIFCHFKYKIIYLLFVLRFQIILDSKDAEDFVKSKQEQVVVRAVLINCESNDDQDNYLDNQGTRFQREELYKHSALQGCRKKLAITLKLIGEPEKRSGDEYIPIEHVFDGSNKKRVRLLNPYILRLSRESPLQAYKLQRIDTVVGVIAATDDKKTSKLKKNRVQRDLEKLDINKKRINNEFNNSALPLEIENKKDQCVKRSACTANSPLCRREKRHEHNIIIEDNIGDDQIPWVEKDRYYRLYNVPTAHKTADDKSNGIDFSGFKSVQSQPYPTNAIRRFTEQKVLGNIVKPDPVFVNQSHNQKDHITLRSSEKAEKISYIPSYDSTEKSFTLYEIGKPELWYSVHAQLFEKMSSPEGKTVWNDITKGDIASVSSVDPEWMGQDLTVKYRSTEWIPEEQYILPVTTSLCLLVPMQDDNVMFNSVNDDFGKYIVVPKDDIVTIEENTNILNKRDGNYSDLTSVSAPEEQSHRRVLVRTSRALISGNEKEMKISSHGSDRFLILPHQNPYHAQIDLEARADSNELVRVGSSGSLITIVADTTRRTRSVITIQAMNKGLAAARFRVKTRDCGPELIDLIDKTGVNLMAGPVLIAPRHTHRYRIELPIEIPLDVAHCSVALINDEEESVAVREVAIKKGDRCFCVWHCDCVCLNEDPKLQCHEMAESRQATAGLSRERPRRARYACYPDVVTLDLFVVVVGVLVAMLILGLAKAVLGFFCRCVAVWGLDYIIQTPRKLDHYYEFNLKNVPVVYDDEGWPVHPDNKKRTVRLVSREMEFVLNLVFFITVPSMMFWDAIKRLSCQTVQNKSDAKRSVDTKKCFSTHDMQGLQHRWRRQCDGLRRWMTPPAEELSTDIWHKDLPMQQPGECDFMRPLLQERHLRTDEILSSCLDSEQDDTEYVLTQMQNSKESLARNQRKMKETGPSTTRKQLNADIKN